ncbi:hypothetical protein F8M41_018749 [Gigaspora margarita]|uniref:Uncharacterized protein n=1 Tax=Gigaspora margarita TaxID=4874 RepID=A0A8H4AL44_GIGMA|nr:hypothetical protein F8M41_018749 [Gigaspora margarita]
MSFRKEIKSYLEKTRPSKASYNDFLHKNKALAKQSKYETWLTRNSQLKKQFILIARELRYDENFIEKFKDEKVDKGLWRKIEDMQGSILIKYKRIEIKRRVDSLSVDNIQDYTEETSTCVLSLSNESSILENLENWLTTTYKVVSLFDRQFPYTKELYNTFPDQIRILENEWEKVEVNIQKTIEEGWEVSRAKKLVDKYYEEIVKHFDETSDIDHEMLITVFSKPPFSDFSYKRDAELIWCQKTITNLIYQFLRSRSSLFNNEASESCYRSEIVDPLLAGTFEMIERSVWLENGEIENEIQKMQRNDTKDDNERSNLGMKHDGVINMIVHGKKYQIGFIEVVGNAFNNDLDRNIELEKLYKAMSLSLWNQCTHLYNETLQFSAFAILVHGNYRHEFCTCP